MAKTLTAGLKVSLKLTPQAGDDDLHFGENGGDTATTADLLENDGGGAAARVWGIFQQSESEVQNNSSNYINVTQSAGSTSFNITGPGGTGTVSYNETTGEITFTPITNVEGLDDGEYADFGTFTYVIRLGNGTFSTATARVWIDGANDAPVAVTDSYNVVEDTPLAAASILGNDTDVDDEDLDVAAVTIDGVTMITDGGLGDLDGVAGTITFNTAAGGTVVLNTEDGTFTYAQNGAFNSLNNGDTGQDGFQYIATDGTANSNLATVTIDIAGVTDIVVSGPPTPPPVFTGTGDPNDFDNLGNPAGQNISSTATNGNDTLYGGAGADTINGGGGDDTIYGGSGGDSVDGNNEDDALYGGSGNDTVKGSNGDDIIIGGYGADTLTGGNGNDTFKYLSTLDTGDTITDFVSGTDKIDFSALSAGTLGFVAGDSGAGVVANSVTWTEYSGNTVVSVDTTGDTTADLQITLTGINLALTANDFVL